MQQDRDFVLMMLGAPTLSVPLTAKQIDLCYERADRAIKRATAGKQKAISDDKLTELRREGAICFAEVMLAKQDAENESMLKLVEQHRTDWKRRVCCACK